MVQKLNLSPGEPTSSGKQFEEVEHEALVKLKPLRYGVIKQVMVTVMKNGYVCLGEDIHYSSVPYNYIGKKVKVLYTSIAVKIYYQYSLIAFHRRNQSNTVTQRMKSPGLTAPEPY
jgi:hypothetical protein